MVQVTNNDAKTGGYYVTENKSENKSGTGTVALVSDISECRCLMEGERINLNY